MKDRARARGGSRRFWPLIGLVLLGAAVLWVLIPVARVVRLVEIHSGGRSSIPPGLAVRSVAFRATDGTPLRGWFIPTTRIRPLIILVAGFQADRATMLPYARMLAGRYAVLLYDSRGTGESGGIFTFGLREVDDVLGAARFAEREGLSHGRPIGVLGVSLGSGDAIVAATRDRHIRAVVADSPYTDQHITVTALDQLHLGPLTVPLAPVAQPLLDYLVGGKLAAFRPVDAVSRVSPCALFLIHARFDANVTTPLSAVRTLFHRARPPVSLWIAPHGGHAGALAAQPQQYAHRVLAFFARYLG